MSGTLAKATRDESTNVRKFIFRAIIIFPYGLRGLSESFLPCHGGTLRLSRPRIHRAGPYLGAPGEHTKVGLPARLGSGAHSGGVSVTPADKMTSIALMRFKAAGARCQYSRGWLNPRAHSTTRCATPPSSGEAGIRTVDQAQYGMITSGDVGPGIQSGVSSQYFQRARRPVSVTHERAPWDVGRRSSARTYLRTAPRDGV